MKTVIMYKDGIYMTVAQHQIEFYRRAGYVIVEPKKVETEAEPKEEPKEEKVEPKKKPRKKKGCK